VSHCARVKARLAQERKAVKRQLRGIRAAKRAVDLCRPFRYLSYRDLLLGPYYPYSPFYPPHPEQK
jgi:hypothetical protein